MTKKLLISAQILAVCIIFSACLSQKSPQKENSQNTENSTQNTPISQEKGTIPFDFPSTKTTAKTGDFVLVPSQDSINNAWKTGGEASIFTFISAKIIKPGEAESEIETSAKKKYTLPNSMIIQIKPNQNVQKGDIVLTQGPSGISKAIVLQGGLTPRVSYLSTPPTEAILPKNSFHKLDGKLEPGITVAIKDGASYKEAILINTSGDKALVIGFENFVSVEKLDRLIPIPTSLETKPGDTIKGATIGTYRDIKVKSINEETGQVVAEYDWAKTPTQEIFYFGEIINKFK